MDFCPVKDMSDIRCHGAGCGIHDSLASERVEEPIWEVVVQEDAVFPPKEFEGICDVAKGKHWKTMGFSWNAKEFGCNGVLDRVCSRAGLGDCGHSPELGFGETAKFTPFAENQVSRTVAPENAPCSIKGALEVTDRINLVVCKFKMVHHII